jgi:hypothetical protein
MKTLLLAALPVTLIAGFGAAAALSAHPAPAAVPQPLLPLSDADQTSSKESGCTCAFYQGRKTFVQLINRELMIRTAAGRQICHVTEKQSDLLSDAKGSASCGGRTLALKRTGRATDHPEADSTDGPATLTVTLGKSSTPLRGTWGCAC